MIRLDVFQIQSSSVQETGLKPKDTETGREKKEKANDNQVKADYTTTKRNKP